MKKLLLGIFSFMIAVLFTACAGSSNPELKNVKYMNDMEIKEVFNDRTIEGVANRGARPFKLFFKSDGTVTGNVGDKSIDGTWNVKDGVKCMDASGRTFCRKHFMKDGKYYTVDVKSNRITSSFTSK